MRARFMTWLALALVPWSALGEGLPSRVLLVPVDDRPAGGQFAQMIADMAGVTVETPPAELLGQFTQPGRPEQIIAWMEQQGLARWDAVVLSTDMIAYGGLIASRTDRSSYNLAIRRLREFQRLRRSAPETRVYAFSAVMRLAPTATRASAGWRAALTRYAEVKERHRLSPTPDLLRSLRNLEAQIPPVEIERYERTRKRNHDVQRELARLTQQKVFDFLLFGQDDAQAVGPHVPERRRLQQMVANLGIGTRVQFAEGIDQHSNVLVSRALVERAGWSPRIRIVFADEQGRQKIAMYESEPVDDSLKDQIVGSGARIAGPGESFDYSLYVNTPDPRQFELDAFLSSLKSEVDQGFPVAVADINLGKAGTADNRLYDALMDEGRSVRLLAYAGWNTAGNTMGTTIPAANVYLLARRQRTDPLHREMALRRFLLHRLVNDFEYHTFVRPEAYAMIDRMPTASREETYGADFERVDRLVRDELTARLERRFQEQMLGTRFFAGNREYEVTGLDGVRVYLPWPRAYEVTLDFVVVATPVGSPRERPIPIVPLGSPDRSAPGRGGH